MPKLRKILNKLYITVQVVLLSIGPVSVFATYVHDSLLIDVPGRLKCAEEQTAIINKNLEKQCLEESKKENYSVNGDRYLGRAMCEYIKFGENIESINEKCKISSVQDGYQVKVTVVEAWGPINKDFLFSYVCFYIAAFWLYVFRRWLIWMFKD